MVGQNQAKDRESRQGKGIVGNGVIYYSAVPETLGNQKQTRIENNGIRVWPSIEILLVLLTKRFQQCDLLNNLDHW